MTPLCLSCPFKVVTNNNPLHQTHTKSLSVSCSLCKQPVLAMIQVWDTLGAPPGLPQFVKVTPMAFPLTIPKPLKQTEWYQIRLWSSKLGGIWNLPCREHSSAASRKKIGHRWAGVTDPGRGQMGVFRCFCSGKAGWVTGQSVDTRQVKSISSLAIGLWRVILDSPLG